MSVNVYRYRYIRILSTCRLYTCLGQSIIEARTKLCEALHVHICWPLINCHLFTASSI